MVQLVGFVPISGQKTPMWHKYNVFYEEIMSTALRKRKVSFTGNQRPTKEQNRGGLFNDVGELTGGSITLKTFVIEVIF